MSKEDYFYQAIPVYGMCPRPTKDYIVEGKGSDEVYRLVTLKVLPCSRSAGCVDAAAMAKANFQIILPSSNFDVSDYMQPHRFVLNVDDIFYVNPSIKQMFNSKIKQVTIKDSGGIFPTWSERKVIYDIGSTLGTQAYRPSSQTTCSAADVAIPDNPNCVSYFEYSFQSSGILVYMKRSYQTLFSTLGNIGGTSGVIMLAITLLYLPFVAYLERQYLLTAVYPLVANPQPDSSRVDEITKRSRFNCCRRRKQAQSI